jgi:hypothetical protein
MVHKRYIKKRGKLYGPYFYKSIRTSDGKVKNIYLGSSYEPSGKEKKSVVQTGFKVKSIFLVLFFLVIFGLIFYVGFNPITGKVVYNPISQRLVLEDIGEQFIHVGQIYNVQLETRNFEGNVVFKDDTELFDISDDGKINFKPEKSQLGQYPVAIITKSADNQEEAYLNIIRFNIIK